MKPHGHFRLVRVRNSSSATYPTAMTTDGVRMASAIGETLHCLNSSLINKEVQKKEIS